MGFFAGIDKAERINRLPPLNNGHYRLQVLKCEAFTGAVENGSKAMFKATVLVLESGPGLSPPGSVTSYMQQMNTKNPQIAKAAVAELIGACCGINPMDKARRQAEITEQVADSVILPANPLGGSIIDCTLTAGAARTDAKTGQPLPSFQQWAWVPVADPVTGQPMRRPIPPEYANIGSEPPAATGVTPGSVPTAGGWPGMAPAQPTPGSYNPAGYGAPQGFQPPAQGFTPPGGPAQPGPVQWGGQQFQAPVPAAFPPPGWQLVGPGLFWRQGLQAPIQEGQLRAMMAAGQA